MPGNRPRGVPLKSTPVREAAYAIMAAAHYCPSRENDEAFWDYQTSVMERLRENLRTADAEQEKDAA